MDFFSGQESLTTIQWVLRAIVAYIFLLLATKIMGERSIAQLRLLDFVMALLLGNIIAHPLSDESLGLKGSMVSMTVLVTLYITSVFMSLKVNKFKTWFEPLPFPIIKDGNIIYKNLAKARITLEHLLSELRKEKIEEVSKVSLALWEPDGTISFFLHSQYQNLTPTNMEIVTRPFSFPKPIVKEGKIDMEELKQMGKSEAWLIDGIKNKFSVEIKDILLATIDNNYEIKIYLYQ